jgi:hypothetical protein
VFSSLIDKYVAPVLAAKGFDRRKLLWNRRCHDVIHVLDIQLSKSSSAEERSFTINLGVLIEQVRRLVLNKPVPAVVQESECFPRLRIGQVIGAVPLPKDVWWSVNATTNIDRVGLEVHGLLINNALPLLDKLDSADAALTLAENPMLRRFPIEHLYYAVLKHVTGAHAEAQEILDKMRCRDTAWQERVRKVSERLTDVQ